MDLGLKNKNVLVTGGSKGIGLAVAEFCRQGANVAINARMPTCRKRCQNLARGRQSWGRWDSRPPG